MKNLGRFWVFSFAILFSVFVFSIISCDYVFASVNGVIFFTEPQSISTGISSEKITIQAQGSSNQENIPETADLYLTSSSQTGLFSSNNSNWQSVNKLTMNKGTANRSFYYKDSSSGDFMITARLVLRTAGTSWTATQNITVGGSGGVLISTSTNSGNLGLADEADDTSFDSDTSAHYEVESLSNYEEMVSGFKVSAGRDRVTYVGSPVSFEAKTKISGDTKNKGVDYLWSFGDGSSSSDEKVVHIYKYPGEYNVVLNATLDDVNSISRAVVRVLAPNLIMTVLPDLAIEITNKGAEEINLYGWKLQVGSLVYSFPLDTIISAGKKVAFPAEYTKIASNSAIALVDATGKIVAQSGSNLAVLDPNKVISTEDFQRFIVEYQKSISLSHSPILANEVKVKSATTSTEAQFWSDHYDKVTEEALSTSSVAVIDEEEGDVGFWSKVFHPVRTIKNAFYK